MIATLCTGVVLALKSVPLWSSPVSLLALQRAGSFEPCIYCGTANDLCAEGTQTIRVLECAYCHRRFVAKRNHSDRPDGDDTRG